MEANVTLHWFVHPRWFDELGGWRQSENVRYYVEWAELAFKLWGECSASSCIAVILHHITCVTQPRILQTWDAAVFTLFAEMHPNVESKLQALSVDM